MTPLSDGVTHGAHLCKEGKGRREKERESTLHASQNSTLRIGLLNLFPHQLFPDLQHGVVLRIPGLHNIKLLGFGKSFIL